MMIKSTQNALTHDENFIFIFKCLLEFRMRNSFRFFRVVESSEWWSLRIWTFCRLIAPPWVEYEVIKFCFLFCSSWPTTVQSTRFRLGRDQVQSTPGKDGDKANTAGVCIMANESQAKNTEWAVEFMRVVPELKSQSQFDYFLPLCHFSETTATAVDGDSSGDNDIGHFHSRQILVWLLLLFWAVARCVKSVDAFTGSSSGINQEGPNKWT